MGQGVRADLLAPLRITEQMATRDHGVWTASIVIVCEHPGLRPEFRALENELYRVLARIDDPREVREYLKQLGCASRDWLLAFDQVKGKK